MTQIITESYAETRQQLIDLGVKFNEVDLEAFSSATAGLYDDMVTKDGCSDGIFDKLKAELAKMK